MTNSAKMLLLLLCILIKLNYFLIAAPIVKSVKMLKWSGDEIPNEELCNAFGTVPAKQNNQKVQKSGEIRSTSPKSSAYDETFVVEKILPMAGAAYGTQANIRNCLAKIFPKNDVERFVQVPCQGINKEMCSGFVAASHADEAIILSFRGTDSFPQLVRETGQTIFKKRVKSPFGVGLVSSYFMDIFTQLEKNGILQGVQNMLQEYPYYQLWITGHSLGGALAALAAAKMAANNMVQANRVKLVTFGQPRVGDAEWAAAMEKAYPNNNFRIVSNRDIVPHVPPRIIQNYRHYMTEIWYYDGMDADQKNAFRICNVKGEDEECSNGMHIKTISEHLVYFGQSVSGMGKNGCA